MRPATLFFVASPLVASQTLCGQYDTLSVGQYVLSNNKWGEDSGTGWQCVTTDGLSGNSLAWHADWEWQGGDNNVKSYPNAALQIGNKQIVSSIPTMPTTAEWSYTGPNLSADVSYDLFTAADPNHNTYSGDYELMIWLSKYGSIQPIGSSTGTVNVAGYNWDLWYGTSGSQQTFSFVSESPIASFNADVMEFFDYLAEYRNFPASSQYLLSFEFGTEPFTGGQAAFDVHSWSSSIGN